MQSLLADVLSGSHTTCYVADAASDGMLNNDYVSPVKKIR